MNCETWWRYELWVDPVTWMKAAERAEALDTFEAKSSLFFIRFKVFLEIISNLTNDENFPSSASSWASTDHLQLSKWPRGVTGQSKLQPIDQVMNSEFWNRCKNLTRSCWKINSFWTTFNIPLKKIIIVCLQPFEYLNKKFENRRSLKVEEVWKWKKFENRRILKI